MRQLDLAVLAERLLPIARKAGEAILSVYGSEGMQVAHKSDSSPVTEADLAAHHVLLGHLADLIPGCPVVSEESDHQLPRPISGSFWLIDPLDGTKEFIARNGEFTVNIALIEAGRSVLGVVYAPAMDTLFWGGSGIGAFRRHGDETAVIQVGGGNAEGPLRVVASKSHLNHETQRFINRLGAVSLVQAGSSLKFCRIAEGTANIYPRLAPTCEWDTAAAQAVLEGAGGQVMDLAGAPLRYGKAEILNPSFIATRHVSLIPT